MFVSENTRICDGCDTYDVRCAVISILGNITTSMCKDCIEGILETLDPSILREKKIEKILK